MKYFIALLYLCSFGFVSAQHSLLGTVLDQKSVPLYGATVVLLEPVDSSMVAFAISDGQGEFILDDVQDGVYILQISFVSYKTLYADISVSREHKLIDIGRYQLEQWNEVLQEVTVKADHIPMGIIGDTISYNAAAFQTRAGASVEDLLKKMPGIEVQRDGSIKAMGEDVDNVLVDGKEFFGDDPLIATKNLEAEAVDKVQVFDKQSEMAEFTGIDDGQEEKTINLLLKEEYKTGGFGNVEVASGNSSRYKSKLNYNRFSPQMQAAVILSANNINEQAFSFNQYIQFMGGLANAIASSNGMINFGDFMGGDAPQGLTDNYSGGINFNYDFSNKLKLNSHYMHMTSDKELITNTISDKFSDNGAFTTIDSLNSYDSNHNHRISAKFDYKPNPLSQIMWKTNLYGIQNDLSSRSSTSFVQAGLMTGITSSDLLKGNSQLGYEGLFQWRRKFDKKGRNWINTMRYQIGKMDDNNSVLNDYYFNNVVARLDQMQEYIYAKNTWSIESSLTEPLGKKFYLTLGLSHNWDNENPRKRYFDRVESEQVLNKELSSAYDKINNINRAVFSLRKNSKRMRLNGGISSQWTNISGAIEEGQVTIDNQSFYLLPSFSGDYEISREKSIEFSYRTNINLPTLNQLAPLPDNTNPNLLILGNPELAPEYAHQLDFGYHAIDQFNYKSFFVRATINSIKDRIVNNISIDDQLLTTLSPINTDNYFSATGYASYSAPIRALKIKYNLSSRIRFADYESNINGFESAVSESNANLNLSIDNRYKDNIDISIGLRMDYNIRRYEVNEEFNRSFYNYALFIDGSWQISNSWILTSSFDHVTYSGETFSEGQNYNIWNASLRKSFQEDRFSIEIKANDLLNDNRGLTRSGSLNGLSEQRYNTLSRFVMIGCKYKLGRRSPNQAINFE